MNYFTSHHYTTIDDFIDLENLPDGFEDPDGTDDPEIVPETIDRDLFFKADYAFEDEEAAKAALLPFWLYRASNRGLMKTRLMLLASAMGYSDTGKYLAYPRHNARYTGMQRYFGQGYGYKRMIAETGKLTSKGLLEHVIEPPMSHRTENPRQSRFKATQKCIDALSHLKLKRIPPECVRLRALFEFNKRTGEEIMVFRKEPGRKYVSRIVGYEDDEHTEGMRDRLRIINRFLFTVRMQWEGMTSKEAGYQHRFKENGVFVTPIYIVRSFCRNSFDLYGRFHGFWQNHKFWSRQLIKLNDEETCEPDFSQIHVNLSYLEKGLMPPKDGYHVDGYDRETIKATFPILINASNVHAAAGALASKLKITEAEAYEIIARVKEVHSPIADKLHSDYGVELMFIDSQICEKVMLQLVEERIPFLPIHDGFRIPKSHNYRVTQIMKEAFASLYPGFESHVKTKGL